MKKINYQILSLMIAVMVTACKDRSIQEMTYTGNVPVYMSYEELRSSVRSEGPKNIEIFGKIYLYNNLLLINEPLKGIHVFNNTNPSNPEKLKFINVPGSVDIAVKNDILYTESFVDFVGIDISDLNNIKEVKRTQNVFSYKIPIPEQNYRIGKVEETMGVVMDYTVEEIVEKEDVSYGYYDCFNCIDLMFSSEGDMNTAAQSSGPNLAGSMASILLVNDYIYAIDEGLIETFDVATLTLQSSTNSFRNLETIFANDDKIFLGTTTGMLVYDISSPESPTYFSDFNHAESCDPVVVQGDYAYVTLRSGNRCGGWLNQLDVINISNLASPFLEKSYEMTNPHGLGIDNKILFICDGEAGLKVYNASDVDNLELISTHSSIKALDVIPFNNRLVAFAEDGIYQYEYDALGNITLLSFINN